MSENNKKIFLVEDDPAIIDIYETMMKKANYDVQVISSGEGVMQKIKSIEAGEETKPDLILLDLILPDMNGVELLKEIRSKDAMNGTMVFILTNQEKTAIQDLGDVKPDKFIVKANISPMQLVETIKAELG